jgi:diguanylate cyclase (GGDEF)-like protein
MSEQGDPAADAASSVAAEVHWRELYETAEAQRATLAEQVRQLEQVRQQLANYAADLNHTYLEFRRRLNQMRVLHEVNLQIGAFLDAGAVVRATMDALQRLVPATTIHVFLREHGAYEVHPRASWAAAEPVPPPSSRHEELVREAMATGEVRMESEQDPVSGENVATLVVPLRAQARALGGLCVVRQGGAPEDRVAVQLVELCAAASAAALANAALYEQSQRLALTDPLTGLYNRRSLERLLEQELDKARRLGYPVGVLVVDVDEFKQINDRLGHLQGDKVLGGVSRALRRALRQIDSLARFGGDEFVALLPGCEQDALRGVGEKLRATVARLRVAGLQGGEVTISLGAAAAHGAGVGAKALLAEADEALYRAKTAGRNCVTMADAQPTRASTVVGCG